MSSQDRRAAGRVVAAVVLAVTVALGSGSATAQPADPMERYEKLSAQAASTNEELMEAQQKLREKRKLKQAAEADLADATAALRRARAAQRRFRDKVDEFIGASFRGANLNQLSAVLTSRDTQELLDQMAALNALAADRARALGKLRSATDAAAAAQAKARGARDRAADAVAAAERLVKQVRQRQAELRTQMSQVRQALNQLSLPKRASLATVQDTGSYSGPPGAANDALQAALSKRGSEYEWGAEGPTEFDCSGLTMWAYQQAGVSIPRTAEQQYRAGTPVAVSELQPGDLLFYDDGTGNPEAIHHVGMYVGNGKMIDAPTEGQLVDIRSMEGDGHFIGARRMVG